MSQKDRVRNVGIVAHIDHGKTTMTDSLLVEAGLLPAQVAGTARALDYLKEEQERGITIKTANISLLHEIDGKPFIINLVDTPGHVDFTGKVTRALRAIDSAIVVVDAVEEIMAQTETVVHQALQERVKPLLFINKVDRLIDELKLNADEIQRKFTRIVGSFNDLIETHGEPDYREKWKADPARDSVVFGSALHRWGLTLSMIREKSMRVDEIVNAYADEKYKALSEQLPLHDAILDMTIRNGPSPIEAQRYRVPRIWKGILNSDVGQAMVNCDDAGPTVMCVTNVQVDSKTGLVATVRVFSGSAKEGDRVYLLGADKEHEIRQVSMYMSLFREATRQIPAGNIAALVGLDLARAGETVVDVAHKDEMVPFETMQYVSEPVITVAVEPKNPEELARLSEVLNRLTLEDPNLATSINERTGEYLLSGMGELHLETAVRFLKEYAGELDITISEPVTEYRESIAGKGRPATARTPNKHNSLCVQVEPMEEREPHAIAVKRTGNLWALDQHGNAITESTKSRMLPDEVKNAMISGFLWACRTGPLCEHPLRNVKVRLLDAQADEDPAERDPAQITRTMSRAIFGSFLTATPILLEPVFKIEVSTSSQWFGTCTKIITSRRGKICATKTKGTIVAITGYIPVAETVGLSAEVRSSTSGHAFWQNVFDHWEPLSESIANEVIRKIRLRRGLPPEVPKPDKFADGV